MNIQPRDIINASCCSPTVLKRLKPHLPEYEQLIDEFLKHQDEDLPSPKNNKIYSALDLKPVHFTKLVKQFYKDAINLIQQKPILGDGNVETSLNLKNQWASFNFKYKFTALPRVGDELDFYFIKPMLKGFTFYHVDSVLFNMEASAEIIIYCKF